MRVHTSNEILCNNCGKLFINLSISKGHTRCHICGKISLHKMALSKHKVHRHSEKNFQCDICDKCFSQRTALKEHVSKVHESQNHEWYTHKIKKSGISILFCLE